MIRKRLNNWALIAGNGRNVGKTWLAEQCIKQLSESHNVIGLKVASHMHDVNSDITWLDGVSGQWMIGEEGNPDSEKDSGRMLKAGASRVFYAQLTDDWFSNHMLQFMEKQVNTDSVVICESAAIGNFIEPGLAFFVFNRASSTKICQWPFTYHNLESVNSRIINSPKEVIWEKNSWQMH